MASSIQNGKTVLVIDDDPYMVEITAHFFKAKGFKVLSTTDPENAYHLAETEMPDLIISDISMPGLDGITLLSGLKENKITQNIPLVFLTGMDHAAEVDQGSSLGARAYLLKPINWDQAWPRLQPLLAH